MSKIQNIAIIGTGMAGISCAKVLQAAGKTVTLFDKSVGPGGRMSSRLFEQWTADHGAQYFTAKDEPFNGVVNSWLAQGFIEPWLGKIVSIHKDKIEQVENSGQRFAGVPNMNSLAKYLVEDLTVKYSHTINKIERDGNHWKLCSKEHGPIQDGFDLLVIAIPAKQASALIPSKLTSLQKICTSAQMLPCWTLIAYQDSKIDLPFDGAFIDESPFSWIARNNSKPARSSYESWTAQANPEWSKEYMECSNYEVEPLLVSAFEKITGQPCKLYQSHLWRYARVEHPQEQSFILDQNHGLGICGDWLLHSTVEGAWTSGYLLAEQIQKLGTSSPTY